MHSANGPSSLERRALCPGSLRVEASIEYEETFDPNRESGVTCHMAMEHLVKGLPIPELDEKEFEKVMAAVKALNRALDGDEIIPGSGRTRLGGIVLCEHFFPKLPYSLEGAPPECGTLDLAIYYPGSHILVLDWKFGGGFVDAPKWNLQMHGYVLSLWADFELVPVSVVIVQPDAQKHYDAVPWVFETNEFQPMLDNLMGIVRDAYDPLAQCHVGRACKYCRGTSECQTRLSALGLIGKLGADWKTDYVNMDLMDRARFITGVKAAAGVCEEVVEFAKKTVLTSGEAIPGYSSSITTKGSVRLAPTPRQPSWPAESTKRDGQGQRPARITGIKI